MAKLTTGELYDSIVEIFRRVMAVRQLPKGDIVIDIPEDVFSEVRDIFTYQQNRIRFLKKELELAKWQTHIAMKFIGIPMQLIYLSQRERRMLDSFRRVIEKSHEDNTSYDLFGLKKRDYFYQFNMSENDAIRCNIMRHALQIATHVHNVSPDDAYRTVLDDVTLLCKAYPQAFVLIETLYRYTDAETGEDCDFQYLWLMPLKAWRYYFVVKIEQDGAVE